jgi:hypothetical protein
MDAWYLLDETASPAQPLGPYTDAQLREMVASGRVTASTRIARAGGTNWGEAGTEPVFAGLFRSAPPRSPDFTAIPYPTPVFANRFSFGSGLTATFDAFKTHWKPLLAIGLVSFGVWLALSIPQIVGATIDAFAQRQEPSALNLLLMAGSILLQVFLGLPFLFGCVYAASQALRGQMRLEDTLIGFRNYGRVLVGILFVIGVYIGCFMMAYIPFFVITMFTLIFAVGTAGAGFALAPFIGCCGMGALFVVLLVLFALILMRVVFVPLVAIDPVIGSRGVGNAISYCWRASKGLGWPMLGVFLVVGVLASLTILLLGVGYLLIGLPLFFAMLAVMHEMVNRSGIRAPAADAGATAV